jgi:mono/diheme cytochrome c family protein
MRQLAIAIVLGALVAAVALFVLRRKSAAPNNTVPPALRPGDIDAVLEADRLTKIQWWLFGLSVFFAIFLPAYWLMEPTRMTSDEKKFHEESIERGKKYFAMRTHPETGEENIDGVECARCHGDNGQGGSNDFLNPRTGQRSRVQVPELKSVFARYEEPPEGFKDARAYIKETIERGRPGTDMPTWGAEFGGPLTDQQIEDIINWMESIQGEVKIEAGASGQQIFSQNCASCHGPGGSGGSAPPMTGGGETRQFPNIDDHIKFVSEGSKPGQRYGTSGMGTGGMPPWGTSMTPEQIRAVVEYERTL